MWTALALLCSANNLNQCITVAGPFYQEESVCYEDFEAAGVSYLNSNYPGMQIKDFQCVYWGPKT